MYSISNADSSKFRICVSNECDEISGGYVLNYEFQTTTIMWRLSDVSAHPVLKQFQWQRLINTLVGVGAVAAVDSYIGGCWCLFLSLSSHTAK